MSEISEQEIERLLNVIRYEKTAIPPGLSKAEHQQLLNQLEFLQADPAKQSREARAILERWAREDSKYSYYITAKLNGL